MISRAGTGVDRPISLLKSGLRKIQAPALAALLVISVLLPSAAQAQTCLCLKCLTGLFQMFQTPSGSMKPAIEPGACALVQKGSEVQRGSIIVFQHPVRDGETMIGRLIGLPGDMIEVRAGQLTLNGAALPQTPLAPYVQISQPEGPMGNRPRCPSPVKDGARCSIDQFTETLPDGSSYNILDLMPDSISDDIGPFAVPPGHVFVLGDNRDDSLDSRFAPNVGGPGFIPTANILGPVVEITNP